MCVMGKRVGVGMGGGSSLHNISGCHLYFM